MPDSEDASTEEAEAGRHARVKAGRRSAEDRGHTGGPDAAEAPSAVEHGRAVSICGEEHSHI
jgi:hypothetical protein